MPKTMTNTMTRTMTNAMPNATILYFESEVAVSYRFAPNTTRPFVTAIRHFWENLQLKRNVCYCPRGLAKIDRLQSARSPYKQMGS